MSDPALDDLDRDVLHSFHGVFEESMLGLAPHETEKLPWLPVIVVAVAVAVAIGVARDLERRLLMALVLNGPAERVRLVIGIRIGRRPKEAHRAVLVVIVDRASRGVNRKRFV